MLDNKKRTIDIIGYDSGWGCGDYGCEDGPSALQADQMLHDLQTMQLDARWHGPLGLKHLGVHKDLDTKDKTFAVLMECLSRLGAAVTRSVTDGNFPVVIGGDHACGAATWSAVTAARQTQRKTGLIWVDAHLDCHTYETSWQGKFGGWWHGQPVAALAGQGKRELVDLFAPGMKIDPAHIVIVGAHSFEPAERAFVEQHNIRVCWLEEVEQRGFDAVFAEAVDYVTSETDIFGVSIDLDVFRQEDAPGVGAAEKGGLTAAKVIPVLAGLARNPALAGLEIVEYNPHKDKDGRTERLIRQLIASIFT